MFRDFQTLDKRTDVAEDKNVALLMSQAREEAETLSPVEVLGKLREYRATGNIALRDEIINANMGLIVKAATVYMPSSEIRVAYELADLVNEGCIGFMAGLDKYDEEKANGKFVTSYCFTWACKYILLYLDENHKTVTNVGARPIRLLNQYHKEAKALIQEYETENIPMELALPHLEGPKRSGTRDGVRQLMVAGNPRTDSFNLAECLPDGIELGEDPMAAVRRAIATLPTPDQQLINAHLEGEEELHAECAKQKIALPRLAHRMRAIANAIKIILIKPVKPSCSRVLEALGGMEDRECPGLFSHPQLPYCMYDDGETLLIQARDMETRKAWEWRIPATASAARDLIRAFNPGWELRVEQATLLDVAPDFTIGERLREVKQEAKRVVKAIRPAPAVELALFQL